MAIFKKDEKSHRVYTIEILLYRMNALFLENELIVEQKRNKNKQTKPMTNESILLFSRDFSATIAVHYFSMSNKAISMCPDQGPRF